ncbi:hypothetical protein [Methyloversatilis universalis]|uniref:hypothetical protein n=1 Tax=Methyloversatilis universalis TaxID=378211 RepID=UPI0018DEDAD5|nr:hypothetical protein [Methyloversatilis universalis]
MNDFEPARAGSNRLPRNGIFTASIAVMTVFRSVRPLVLFISAIFAIAAVACTKPGCLAMSAIPAGADTDLREHLGYPPKKEDWSFDISPGDAGWSYRFMMFEGAEQYLGTEVYESLPERFAKIPGVTQVEQEDRESYLINSTLPETELEAQLWTVFQAAASEAHTN